MRRFFRRVEVLRSLMLPVLLALAACSNSTEPDPPTPVPTVDLTGYFVLPAAGFIKFFNDGTSRTWIQDTVVNGVLSSDAVDQGGIHEYLATSNRAWVGTLDTSGFIFLLDPPLAAIPDLMPETGNHVGASGFVTQTETVPVRRISRLIDTALSVVVPAGTFDSVVLIRQEFWTIRTILGATDTLVDSAYRWYAPGVDEIRRIQWLHSVPDSSLKEFSAGSVGGNTYP